MSQSQLDSLTISVEHEGETHEVDVTFSSWIERGNDGLPYTAFEIHRIDSDAEIPEFAVAAALSDELSTPLPTDEVHENYYDEAC